MSIPLTTAIQTQIDSKRIDYQVIFKINGTDRTDYLKDWQISYDKNFGSATASFTLNNTGGIFGDNGAYKIYVGDIVEFSSYFSGDATEFKNFYGIIDQRGITKSSTDRTINLTCLDYITILQKTDINLKIEGTKVKISDEKLTPNYLPSPNNSLAQIFDFANNQLAQVPPPIIVIRPQIGTTLVGESPQFDGFDIKYATGQVVLGTPLNALDNYDVYSTYYFYTNGVYAEDIIEQIITTADGYGNYLFGESSSTDLVDNHLKDTFYNQEGSGVHDLLVPNFTTSTMTIKTIMTSAYDPDSSGALATTVYVEDTSGFPASGSATINGDTFTYTGKTATTFTGVSGLSAKPNESYVAYENTYDIGQIWYFKYSNITSTINTANLLNLPSGKTVSYIDYRYGRLVLNAAIDVNVDLEYNGDYTFKTLQATGISLNRILFNERETATRFDALKKVSNYLAPNYVIRTIGDNKIWASYLSQRTVADYTLNLMQNIKYLEDEDIYTRVVMYGKNINPTNIMFNEGINFVSTGQNFQAVANQSELQWEKEDDNYNVYKTTITDAGKIDISTLKPTVFINNVPVNDKPQIISSMPVVVTSTNKTVTTTTTRKSGTPSVDVKQYYYYKIRFAHTNIDPTQNVIVYDSVGNSIITISPHDSNMDYANGIYNVPGDSQNSTVEQSSTASYTVFYSTAGIIIDSETVRFKVSKQLVPNKDFAVVAATFEYWTALTPFEHVGNIIDGRYETQVQTEFYAEPPDNLPYAILDLGQEYQIQAIDFVAGFYRPDDYRKFDIDFKVNFQYSFDNIDYFDISSDTTNIEFTGGSSKSLDEKELGTDFSARYLRLNLVQVKKLDYNNTGLDGNNGVWVVAFSEISAYNNIILKSEAKLIPSTNLSQSINISSLDSSGLYQTIIYVDSTAGFAEPLSGHTETAYIEDDSFTYTGLTSTSFTGVTGLSSDHSSGVRVSQEIESDTTVYDDDGLLAKLGDRLYKNININDQILYDQTQLDALSKAYLKEFYKDHTKMTVDILYAPYIKVGDTIEVTDSYNGKSAVLYFVESIQDSGGIYSLTLARYPE